MRKLWQFMYAQSGGDHDEAEMLAAAMVGRTRDGEPLAAVRNDPVPGVEEKDTNNQFAFDQDPSGARCPFGSHVRRSNPRNADYPGHPTSLLKKLVTMLGFGPRASATI